MNVRHLEKLEAWRSRVMGTHIFTQATLMAWVEAVLTVAVMSASVKDDEEERATAMPSVGEASVLMVEWGKVGG